MDDHLLIMSSDHNHGFNEDRGSQSELHMNSNILLDMFDFYKIMNKKGTMFFNGMAGNTQLHFHFHYTTFGKACFSTRNSFKGFVRMSEDLHVFPRIRKDLQGM